jgi:hypothetical protein
MKKFFSTPSNIMLFAILVILLLQTIMIARSLNWFNKKSSLYNFEHIYWQARNAADKKSGCDNEFKKLEDDISELKSSIYFNSLK